MSFSRVTTKARPFVRVQLVDTVAAVLEDLEIQIEALGAQVIVDPLPMIDADPSQMRQLFQNLLSNALKFHRESVRPEVKIQGTLLTSTHQIAENQSDCPEVKFDHRRCQISVTDNGIGFDEKYLDRIFNVFQRLHNRGTYEGTGVGLAICRKIVERHGGAIAARSKPGQGSTFIVTLPVKQSTRNS